MRTVLLVVGAVLVIGLLFAGYSRLQSGANHKITHSGADPLPAPTTQNVPGKIKPGSGVWVSSYDENGVLKNRFKTDDYTPSASGEGSVEVTNPIAEFYMPNNRMMRLKGTDGTVFMPPSTAAVQKSNDNLITGSPDRGIIRNVTIELFNMLPDANPGVPDETITTDNIEFDNNTRLISTQPPKANPNIHGDMVPVHMESSDHTRGYNLDGKGMYLRWNDKDGRLDLLQISHGQQLIIWDASSASSAFGGERAAKTPPQKASAAPSALPANAAADAPVNNVGTPGNHVRLVAQPSRTNAPTATTHPPIPVPYVATFYKDVRITQGEDALITADRMDVDFISRQNQENPPSANTRPAPTTNPPNAGASTANDVALAMTQPAQASVAPTPSTSPTTKPAAAPVVITWTGKLVMLSAQKDRPKVTPGDAIVELNGAPVQVRRTPAGQTDGDDVKAAKLVYHTADGSAKLFNSETSPQVVISKLVNGKLDPDSAVTTSTLDYTTDPAGKKIAILTGPGHAKMPLAAEQAAGTTGPADGNVAGAHRLMDARWNSGAKVHFLEKSGDELLVDHIDLAGDVDVEHPQLSMQSQELSLFFAAPEKAPATQPASGNMPATQPAKPQQELKRVLASKAVHTVMAGQNGKKQMIDCSELEMLTAKSADGKLFARQVNADGTVHAFDGEQDLRADAIALTLKPATPPAKKIDTENAAAAKPVEVASARTQPASQDSDTAAVELEKMVARDNVLVTNKDGSSAIGSLLIVTTENHENHVRLTGSPMAMVMDVKKNTVIGPVITFEQGVAHVLGEGKMHVLQETQPGGTTSKPMDATWTDHADMNGGDNKIDLVGLVHVTTYDNDGTVNVATGDRVHIDLADKITPTTKPATQPVARDKNAQADSMQMGVMKDKEAKTITLDGNAQVISTLKATDGTVARQFALYAPRIIYQLLESKQLPAKTLFVPSAGKMYVGDHRPPPQQKAGAKNDDAGGRGDTAFDWHRQMVYRESEHNAVMTGDVLVVHWPLAKQGAEDKVRINADRVTALFEPQPHNTKAATQPTTAPAGDASLVASTTHVPAPGPATAPATGPANDPASSLSLKHLTADGQVIVHRESTGATLAADRIDYDPHTHWMTAHGSQTSPARYTSPDPHQSMSGDILEWNADTWNIRLGKVQTLNPQ